MATSGVKPRRERINHRSDTSDLPGLAPITCTDEGKSFAIASRVEATDRRRLAPDSRRCAATWETDEVFDRSYALDHLHRTEPRLKFG